MHGPCAQQGRLVHLYIDDRKVVWGDGFDGHGAFTRLDGGLQEACDRLQREGPWRIRALALRRHASLWLKLYEQFRGQHALEIATPRVIGHDTDPRRVWAKMQLCAALPSSMGGWRAFTEEDYCSQVLVRDLYRGYSHWELPRRTQKCLYKHPAWHDVSFIENVCEVASAVVLAMISDPRWWIDPDHPDRSSSLRSYFRVFPAAARAVESHSCKEHSEAWCDRYYKRQYVRLEYLAAVFGYPIAIDQGRIHEPGSFLARRYTEIGGARGLLSACRTALQYIVSMWRAEIARRYRPEQYQELFVPQHFFSGAALEAYLAHHAKRPECQRT